MNSDFYRPFARARNKEMIEAMLYPKQPGVLDEICGKLLADFSPSFFAEMDWQELRTDLKDDNLRTILEIIDDYVFLMTLAANIIGRETDGCEACLREADFDRLEQLIGNWHQGGCGSERSVLLGGLDSFIESIRRPHWQAAEAKIRANAESDLDDALAKHTDFRRLGSVVEVILSNARYRYLDLPWTRRLAKAELLLEAQELGATWPRIQGGDSETGDPAAMGARLRGHARIAERARHHEWAALLNSAAAAMARINPTTNNNDEGEWSVAFLPCGRCSMWFAVESVSVMDSRCSQINWTESGFVFIPADIGTAACIFCGHTAPIELPKMFYAEHRGQIIYLAPASGRVAATHANEFWRSAIENLRASYGAKLDEPARTRFDNAAELITHNIQDFLYAIQMGETIPENHVFNVIELRDGSALIVDGEKHFARVITPAELAMYKQTHAIETFEGKSPGATVDAIAHLLPPHEQLSNAPEHVEKLLRSIISTNATIDDAIAEARRRRHG